jgi:hypothetical protein
MNTISEEFIRRLEQKLGLRFAETLPETNTCFANNNAELRDDFKQVFTSQDLQYYLKSVQKQNSDFLLLPEK